MRTIHQEGSHDRFCKLNTQHMAGEVTSLGENLRLLFCGMVVLSNYLLNIYTYICTSVLLSSLVREEAFYCGGQRVIQTLKVADVMT